MRITNAQGQVLQTISLTDGEAEQPVLLADRLANGLYYATLQPDQEAPVTWRFVLAR